MTKQGRKICPLCPLMLQWASQSSFLALFPDQHNPCHLLQRSGGPCGEHLRRGDQQGSLSLPALLLCLPTEHQPFNGICHPSHPGVSSARRTGQRSQTPQCRISHLRNICIFPALAPAAPGPLQRAVFVSSRCAPPHLSLLASFNCGSLSVPLPLTWLQILQAFYLGSPCWLQSPLLTLSLIRFKFRYLCIPLS